MIDIKEIYEIIDKVYEGIVIEEYGDTIFNFSVQLLSDYSFQKYMNYCEGYYDHCVAKHGSSIENFTRMGILMSSILDSGLLRDLFTKRKDVKQKIGNVISHKIFIYIYYKSRVMKSNVDQETKDEVAKVLDNCIVEINNIYAL